MRKYYFDELDSTNNYLKREYLNYSDKSIIIAKKQTNGRGRLNRTWLSSDDLTFSMLFKEETKHLHHMIAPLSVVYALKKSQIDSEIKWPNDVYINGLKVAGILVENIYENQMKYCDIVGIGINFTEKELDTSICLNKFNIFDKEKFLDLVIENYSFLLAMSEKDLVELYKIHSIVLGKNVMHNGAIYLIEDITLNGELVLKNGKDYKFINANEIDIKNSIIR